MANIRLLIARVTFLLLVVQRSLAARFPLTHELTSRERSCNTDCSREKTRPVCGSDGQTYNSRCEIRRVRCLGNSVQIKHKGVCEELTKCQAEQVASRMKSQSSTDGVFVPQCEPDGTFSRVQCHQSFGYCWCVTEDGKPIPGSSVQQGTTIPSCEGKEASLGPSAATFHPNTEVQKPDSKGCSQDARIEFNTNLKDIFREEFHRLPTTPQPPPGTTGANHRVEDAQKRVIEWKFMELDSNADMELDRKELNSLGRMMKKIIKPKKCAKTFVNHCDLDQDGRIAKTEWSFCLVDNNEQQEEPTGGANSQEVFQPPIGNIPATPLPPRATQHTSKEFPIISCQAERQRASAKAELHPGTGIFVPHCDVDGSYTAVQCHDEAQYCWCVYIDNGRPIPGTSTPASAQEFNCDENATSRGPTGNRVFTDCEGKKKENFFETLRERFSAEISEDVSVAEGVSPERLARWKFQQMDESANNLLERREYFDFKNDIQKINSVAKKCRRNFIKYCDENSDSEISMGEWLVCMEVRNGNPSTAPAGSNPFIDRLM